MNHGGIWLSPDDVGGLALMLGERTRRHDCAAREHLASVLAAASIVRSGEHDLPFVGVGATVTYEEVDHALQRTVTVVYPVDADAATGHVSVLSAEGRALIGRLQGTTSMIRLADGAALPIRILNVRRAPMLPGGWRARASRGGNRVSP
jgi:regulator of nucleoside diphosphate kinase